jgi:tRNA 2-thiouridine synthesizing protein D
MSDKKKLTFALMDAPYENARTATALRLIDISARRGYDITVFAYEGAVALTFAKQEKHGNSVHGHDVEEEDHPLPREWVASLFEAAKANGGSINWINCGLCVDERGVGEWIDGCVRGGPKHLVEAADASDGTLIMGAR